MARPIKLTLDYFPLDADFFEDDKILEIEADFGVKGSYAALRLLCLIYKTNGYWYQWGEKPAKLFARRLGDGFSTGLVQEIVLGLVRCSFFDKGVFDSFQVLTSAGIQRRYIEAVKRTRTHAEIDQRILVKNRFPQENMDLMQENQSFQQENQDKPQFNAAKENKIKENKIKTTKTKEKVDVVSAVSTDYFSLIENDEKYLTDTACVTGVGIERLKDMIPLFRTQCEATETRHGNLRDVKRHFLNYVNKRKFIQQQSNGKEEANKSNATQRVRWRAEDYGSEI